MRIRLLLIFTLVSFAIKAETYTIVGVVLDSVSQKPIEGAYVVVSNAHSFTNKLGQYKIEGVKAGKTIVQSTVYNGTDPKQKTIIISCDTVVNFAMDDVRQLDEMVVTGTRTAKRLSETPILTTVVNELNIKQTASTSALESLLENIPAMAGSESAMGSSLTYKGLNSRYMIFLVDGERLVPEGASGNINLNQIDVDNIKRIEVVDGAASALYGSNAVGAVINIITKEPKSKIEGGVNVVMETNRTLRTKVDIGANLNKVSMRTAAFRHSSGGFSAENGSGSPYEDWGADVKLKYKPIETIDIKASARFFSHETLKLPGSLSVSHPYTQNWNANLGSTYKSKNNKHSASISTNYNHFIDYEKFRPDYDFDMQRESSATYISARALYNYVPSKKCMLVAGLEYNRESNMETKTLGDTMTTKLIQDANAFAQGEWEPVKSFDIVLGARYTYNSQFGSAFNPKLSLMYEIVGLKFRGGIGTAFRAPSIKELYYDFDHFGMHHIFGNPDLKAEKGLYGSLSVEYNWQYLNLSVSGYYNQIIDKIEQDMRISSDGNGGNRTEYFYHNVSSATIRGFDVSGSYTFFRQLTLKANYSFCDAIDNSTGDYLTSALRHSGNVSLTWNGKIVTEPLSVNITGKFNSPRRYSDEDENGNDVILESATYNIWKIAVVKPIHIKRHTIEVTAKVDNLFNFQTPSYVTSGRMYLIGLRYYFK